MSDVSAKDVTEQVDFITIRLDRKQGGAIGIESNMAFISDQIGLLEMAKTFIVDRWKYAQAAALAREQQRITPANTLPMTRRIS